MPTTMSKKYNIFGENNPHWLMAEPILFDIWADGIFKSKSRSLHGIIYLDGLSEFHRFQEDLF